MTTNVSTDLPKTDRRSLWVGILLIVLGIAAIVLPNVSTLVVETWLALILISAGSTKLFYAFQTRDQGGFVWKLLLSLLYISIGIVLFAYPLSGVLTLTLLLGSFLLTEGTFELILAFRLRPQPNWTSVLANAIVTLALGAIVWFQWPSDAPWLLGTAVGASVISTGASRLMLSQNSGTPSSSEHSSESATSA